MATNGQSTQILGGQQLQSEKQAEPNRLLSYFKEQIKADVLLELELVILSVAVGINDATTFSNYHVFASNQTGNTVLLAVGALGLGNHTVNLPNAGFSLGMFLLGGIVFGQTSYYAGRMRRGWLLFTNVLQTLLIFSAAALRKWVSTDANDSPRYAVIALLAFASGGQVAMARTVNVPEITTAVITSAYIEFVADPNILANNNRPPNRRLFFVLGLLGGCFIGAAAYQKVGPAFALLLSALAKSGVCVLLFFNREKES